MPETTMLKPCWYHYYTGKKAQKEHLAMKLVCTECHYVWDTQGYAFHYCPGCGRYVVKNEEAKKDG